ncbi:MAG: UPF0236 family protein, partial [Eubacteriales bacterium]|nr:UPF0236 family protein [Eubacteriales bacterium]
CEELKNMLQEIDRWLMKTRDKAIYRHKGHRKTCIKTLMGEVEYSRAIQTGYIDKYKLMMYNNFDKLIT